MKSISIGYEVLDIEDALAEIVGRPWNYICFLDADTEACARSIDIEFKIAALRAFPSSLLLDAIAWLESAVIKAPKDAPYFRATMRFIKDALSERIVVSSLLQTVDSSSKSTLPTGRLKIENGILFQEVLTIVHRPSKERSVGMYHDWIPVTQEIAERIRVL